MNIIYTLHSGNSAVCPNGLLVRLCIRAYMCVYINIYVRVNVCMCASVCMYIYINAFRRVGVWRGEVVGIWKVIGEGKGMLGVELGWCEGVVVGRGVRVQGRERG